MALDDLTHVHEFAQQTGRSGRRAAEHNIASLGGSQMVADGANAADTRSDLLHLGDEATFAEFFETAEFVYMEISVLDRAIFFHVDGHFSVTFNSGDWFDSNFLCDHSILLMPVIEFALDFGHSALG